jgi:hypothetical protein
MRKTGATIVELLVLFTVVAIAISLIIPFVFKSKPPVVEAPPGPPDEAVVSSKDAELLKKRFVQSGDLSPAGLYTYHIKDNMTGKEYLIVRRESCMTTIDVTPPAMVVVEAADAGHGQIEKEYCLNEKIPEFLGSHKNVRIETAVCAGGPVFQVGLMLIGEKREKSESLVPEIKVEKEKP